MESVVFGSISFEEVAMRVESQAPVPMKKEKAFNSAIAASDIIKIGDLGPCLECCFLSPIARCDDEPMGNKNASREFRGLFWCSTRATGNSKKASHGIPSRGLLLFGGRNWAKIISN
jgi:hypothetical protein